VPAARILLIATLVLCSLTFGAEGERSFRKLGGAQIRATVAGKEFTDNQHWSEVFWPNGTLTGFSLTNKVAGTWRVQGDLLCIDRGKNVGKACYEVWVLRNNMELRPDDDGPPLEGVLRKPKSGR